MTNDSVPPAPALVETPPSHLGALRLGDPRYQSDPAGFYRQLRRDHGPVAPVLLLPGDVPAWLALGYRELQHVTTDIDTFARRTRRWRYFDHLPQEWPLWPMLGGGPTDECLLFTEGTVHQQRAAALNFALGSVDRLEFKARCAEFASHLISGFSWAGEAELMSAYFMQLPVMALGWAMGVRPEDGPILVHGFNAAVRSGEDAFDGQQRAREIITCLAHDARHRPRTNVVGRLADHPVGLSDAQLIEDTLVTIQAGHQTTAYWGGNSLRLMLTDPRHTDTLARGRLPVSQALREVLWDDTPTQVYLGRYTTQQVDLGSYRIPRGELIILGLAAGNADPHIRPDRTAELRGSRAYLSFSHGPHGCPIAAQDLAEVITTTAIEVLLDRLPDLRLACHPSELRWAPGVFMRGLTALPVTFTPPTAPAAGGSSWT